MRPLGAGYPCPKILVHDHETALYHFGSDHAECNVHVIRYLRKNTEDTGNKWSDKMICLLFEMNKERKELISKCGKTFSEEAIAGYEKRYHGLIKKDACRRKKQNTNTQKRKRVPC